MDASSETPGAGSGGIRHPSLSSILAYGHVQLHLRPRRRDVLASEAAGQVKCFVALGKGDLSGRREERS